MAYVKPIERGRRGRTNGKAGGVDALSRANRRRLTEDQKRKRPRIRIEKQRKAQTTDVRRTISFLTRHRYTVNTFREHLSSTRDANYFVFHRGDRRYSLTCTTRVRCGRLYGISRDFFAEAEGRGRKYMYTRARGVEVAESCSIRE